MNQRIRELAEQAREYATTRHSVSNIVLSINNDKFEQKFAELIIKECIGCCEQVISDPVPNYYIDTWLNGGSQCIDEIKQHFGVEE
jgi:peptidyl-tRNA hydrolase